MRYNRVVRIACLGGGPGGLCFAILAKRVAPSWSVEVWDRNPPDETYGFGVVFSDEAMDAIRRADEPLHDAIRAEFARWAEIDIHFRGRGGHLRRATGSRRCRAARCSTLLQQRAAALGVVAAPREPRRRIPTSSPTPT